MGKKISKTEIEKALEDLSNDNKVLTMDFIEILIQKQNNKKFDNFRHLKNLEQDVEDYVIMVKLANGKDLFHSISTFISTRFNKAYDEILDEYIEKYRYTIPSLEVNKEKVKRLIIYIYNKNNQSQNSGKEVAKLG